MSKSSKYILAAGCSFTDKDFKSTIHKDYDTSYPKWPEIFGEYQGMDVVNLGKSGVGNDYICNVLTKRILEDQKNIDTVVVGWSEVYRYGMFGGNYRLNPITALYRPDRKQDPWQEASRPMFELMFDGDLLKKSHNVNDMNNLAVWMLSSWLESMWQIQELCKVLNIKYIQTKLCGSITLAKFRQIENSFSEPLGFTEKEWHIQFGRIKTLFELDRSHYIGYPFLNTFNGFCFQDKLVDAIRISNKDAHPNAEGHEFIARKFYEHYTKIYP